MAEQSSKRRASAIIAKGLITDSTHYEEGGFTELADFFVGRSGELLGRFPRQSQQTKANTASSTHSSRGCGSIGFHPDLGVIGNFGYATDSSTATLTNGTTGFEYQINPIANIDGSRAWNSTAASADWINFGVGSVPITHNTWAVSCPLSEQNTNLSDEVVFIGASSRCVKWAGATSTYTSAASASGVYWSSGTNIINGSSTTFTSLEEGMYLLVSGLQTTAALVDFIPAFRITEIISDTSLRVDRILWDSVDATARKAWGAHPLAHITGGRNNVGDVMWATASAIPNCAGVGTYHNGRLFLGGVSDGTSPNVYHLNRIRWSGLPSESDAGRLTASSTAADATAWFSGGASGSGHYAHIDHWHPNGFLDVFPGTGGAITGMVSLNNELIIFKHNAVIRMTGSVNFKDAGDSAFSVVSHEVGAGGRRGFIKTGKGIFFAHRTGLYLYDGQVVKNLTSGRVQSKWQELFGSKNRFTVCNVLGKIYVSTPKTQINTPETMVYDSDLDSWSTLLAEPVRCSVSVHDIDDVHVGEWGFYDTVSNNVNYHYYSSIDFDFLGTRSPYYASADGNGDVIALGSTASTPTPYLVAALPIGESPFTEGRLDNLYLEYQHKNRSPEHSASPAYVSATYMYGNPDLTMGTWPTETSTEATSNYNTRDRAYRMSVGGTNWATNAYVYLEFAYGRDTRLFGLGYDHTIRNVIQSNYVTGDG